MTDDLTLETLAQQQQSQANFLEDLARTVGALALRQQQDDLLARLATAAPLRMGSTPSGADVYPAGTTEPGPEAILADGSVVSSTISPGALTLPGFAGTVRPVVLVTSLPTLPDTNYPVGSFVLLTSSSPSRLYKNLADVWVAAIGTNDLQADSVTAGVIAAGAVGASEIAAGAISVGKLADAVGSNFAPNPSFETLDGAAVDTDGVAIFGWETQAFASYRSVAKYGTYGLRLIHLSDTTTKSFYSPYIPVTPGRRLMLRAWVRGDAANNAAAAVRVSLDEYTETSGTAAASTFQDSTVGTGTTFAQLSIASTGKVLGSTTSRVKLRLELRSGGAVGDKVYFDGIEAFYLDDDVVHGSGNVLIDSTGVTINNGKLTFKDNYGATAMDGAGFGGTWQRFLANGVFNGDFFAPPDSLSTELNNSTNPLPWWTYTRASGTACTAQVVADTATASGNKVRLGLASGAAADECYIEQIVPIAGNRGQSFAYHLATTFNPTAYTAGSAKLYISTQHLKKDGVTTTGSTQTWSGVLSNYTAGTLNDLSSYGSTLTLPPADAYYVRIRIGLQRDAATNTQTATVDVFEVRVQRGPQVLVVADSDGSTAPSILDQSAGTLRIKPTGGTSGSLQLAANLASLILTGSGAFSVVGTGGTFKVDTNGKILTYQDNVASTWTPTVTNSGTATWTTRTGRYYKIGPMVFFTINLTVSSAGSGGAGALEISMPTTPADGFVAYGIALITTTFAAGHCLGLLNATGGAVILRDTANVQLTRAHLAAGSIIRISGHYFES